ncbi:hypothetical protein [Oceanobacillus salinisoli]|uniref:hypothetical protein n=1 Tax=Oceanobacillus salinisoli TaxID=2678611 RepID=UPI001E3D9038|nr:hypothetical protein [Oceanobacillus salinisoli]
MDELDPEGQVSRPKRLILALDQGACPCWSTDYSHRDDGTHAIPVALYELERYIAVDNPMVTVESGLVHPEFSTYPTIALREFLFNAFGHRDYRMNGTIMLKQYKDKLILTNPGEFIGGITPQNIFIIHQ